jgi:hypothetical protein
LSCFVSPCKVFQGFYNLLIEFDISFRDSYKFDTLTANVTNPIDRLIDYCFTSRSRSFHLYGNVIITGEWL